MRGEYPRQPESRSWNGGSAPHVRGILRVGAFADMEAGISPACAGNTTAASYRCPRGRGQPRTCGKYFGDVREAIAQGGSAPHMRGIRGCRYRPAQTYGVSPACAGNTSGTRPGRCPCRNQPRVCGEYSRINSVSRSHRGSAPHARGILSMGQRLRPRVGDQPRVCGEYAVRTPSGGVQGSAPHMRGIPGRARDGRGHAGGSPAHAGNTNRTWPCHASRRDQPRTCGEYAGMA